jgi:hypothetical protein
MGCKPPVYLKLRIRLLILCLLIYAAATRRDEVAILTIVVILSPNKLPTYNHVPQVAQDSGDGLLCRSWDRHSFLATLVAREVVHARNDTWVLILGLEKLDCGQSVQGVLESPAPIE